MQYQIGGVIFNDTTAYEYQVDGFIANEMMMDTGSSGRGGMSGLSALTGLSALFGR